MMKQKLLQCKWQWIMKKVMGPWRPEDVSVNNEGYDIRSISQVELKRYIEVKGRSGPDGSVMLSENEMNRLAQLGDSAWLYIVINCKSNLNFSGFNTRPRPSNLN